MLAAVIFVVMLLATTLAKKSPEAYGVKPFGALPSDGKKVAEEYAWGVGEAWSTYAIWGDTAYFLLCAISEFLVWTQAVSFFTHDIGYSLSKAVNLYMIIGVVGIFSMPIKGMFSDSLVKKYGHEAKGRKANLILCPLVGIIACIMILQTGRSVIFGAVACILFPVYWAMMPSGTVGYAGAVYGRKSLGKIWGVATLIAVSIGPATGSLLGGFFRDLTGGVRASMQFAIVPFVVAAAVACTLPVAVTPRRLRQPLVGAELALAVEERE